MLSARSSAIGSPELPSPDPSRGRSAPARSSRRRPPTARWRGFSLVEVLVALTLLSVGLLGMAGSSALALRVAAASAHERRAVQRVEDRIARLTADGCAAASSGAVVHGSSAMDERWRVAAPANGVVLLEAQVWWTAAGRRRTFLLPGAILC